jgi:hypothetical protein
MLTFANRRAFLAARLARLDTLDRELRRYGRIHAMSDGLRHYVELNGATVTADTARLNPKSPGYERWVHALPAILARDSIAPATYEAFRQRLAATGFVEVAADSAYTAFLFDGFVAHGNGFVHVEPGAPAPTVGMELFNSGVRQIEEVGPGWFYFEI